MPASTLESMSDEAEPTERGRRRPGRVPRIVFGLLGLVGTGLLISALAALVWSPKRSGA